MNIFTRIWTIITSHINAFLERVEDPERALEQSIRDMQKQVKRLRGDVIHVIVEEKKLKNQVEKYQREVERWEKNAMLALKQANENLAREALHRKREAVHFIEQLHPQWEQQKVLTSQLKEEFNTLRERVQTAQRKKRNLIVRLRHAETQKHLRGLLTDLSDNQVFDRFEAKLLDTEAMNAAQQELQEESLDRQFEALESGSEMDLEQELNALKQRIELNP